MTHESYPHGEVLHHQHEEPATDKVIKIRVNRNTLFSGILVLLAVVVTVQFVQIRGISAKIGTDGASQQTAQSTTTQQAAPTQGSSSAGALQSLPSQVGGC